MNDMASNYYPMVSSSPPPLDDDAPSFEDDDFGDFASAGFAFGSNAIAAIVEKAHLEANDVGETPDSLEGVKTPNGVELHRNNGLNRTEETNGHSELNCDSVGVHDRFYDDDVQHTSEQASEDCVEVSKWISDDSHESAIDEIGDSPVPRLERTFEEIHANGMDARFLGVESTDEMDKAVETVLNGDDDEGFADGHAEMEASVAAPIESGPSDNVDQEHCAHFHVSFDDFTNFQTSAAGENVETRNYGDDGAAGADGEWNDDAFGNFTAFDEPEATFSDHLMTVPPPAVAFADDANEEDEFGNFNSAFSEPLTEWSSNVDVVVPPTVSTILASSFPELASVDRPFALVKQLDEALTQSALGDNSKTPESLWSHLHDIDNTHALKYRWSHSQSNKKLLHSLHIDARNFLAGTKWNSSVPLFAATLGSDPLEPKKAPVAGGDEEDSKSLVACNLSALNVGCSQESTVPPAQFDWGSSGLVNPLDGLESEFLGSPLSSSEEKAPGVNCSPLMDKILSQAARSSSSSSTYYVTARRRSTNLSAEAIHVLDSLPDLSFMRAKVLMFPIRGALT